MILKLSSSIKVQVKYCFQRDDTLYYQRRIPKDLVKRYGGQVLIKVNLKTLDLKTAARKVDQLNGQHEATWAAMRDNRKATPAGLKAQALVLLKKHHLSPYPATNDDATLDQFLGEHFEGNRERMARESEDPERTYRDLTPADTGSPVAVQALELLNSAPKFLLSDALKVYLDDHSKKDDTKFRDYNQRTWDLLIAVLGDIPVAEVTRAHAIQFKDAILAKGSKTTTAQRLLHVAAAVFSAVILSSGIERTNPFSRIRIGGLGKDAVKREPFSTDSLKKITAECLSKDDDMRWLLALQVDLGCRIAEVTGLSMDDLVLDSPHGPHVVFKPHPWRDLKTKASSRKVPLVGVSLWAAQQVTSKAYRGQQLAFPRYCSTEECKADTASAALNTWMRNQKVNHTTHELRHTMADRLREVGCPAEIRKAIGGWSTSDMASQYGDGHSLTVMRAWLEKVVLKEAL